MAGSLESVTAISGTTINSPSPPKVSGRFKRAGGSHKERQRWRHALGQEVLHAKGGHPEGPRPWVTPAGAGTSLRDGSRERRMLGQQHPRGTAAVGNPCQGRDTPSGRLWPVDATLEQGH